MFFAACPPVYHLPGTWDDPDKIAKCMDTLVPHFNLTPEQGFILFFCLFLYSQNSMFCLYNHSYLLRN